MSKNDLPLLPLILDNVPLGLRQALAQEGVPCRDRRPGPPEGQFILSDCRRFTPCPPAAGQVLIDVDRFRLRWRSDPFDDLLDMRSQRMEWRIGGFRLADCVSRTDKRGIRRGLLGQLRERIEQAGGIWLRVAAFPFPYRSAFSFRIDYDEYDEADFQATLKAIRGYEGATTHFVNGSAYEGVPEAIGMLRGLDVGSHGYWHHTYVTPKENLRNILRGVKVLQAGGIEPSGFAAPHGRFNAGLFAALTELGITHSSEFGLAYDDAPFFVGAGPLLQIPVHPICFGLVLEAAAPADKQGSLSHWRACERMKAGTSQTLVSAATSGARCEAPPIFSQARNVVQVVLEHWEQVARNCCRAGTPLFLYGHPTGRLGRYPQVLRNAIRIAADSSIVWKTTFTELNTWWRERAAAKLTVDWEQDRCIVAAEALPQCYRLAVEYWQGDDVAVMPLDRPVCRFSPGALTFETPAPQPVLHPIRVNQPERFRSRIRRWVDWERVTPAGEIPANSLPNVAKRVLRRLL